MVFNPLKILPFFIFQKISLSERNTPQGILKIFNGWDEDGDATYKEHIIKISEIFHGRYMFTTENFELERRKACLQKELEYVEGRLKK